MKVSKIVPKVVGTTVGVCASAGVLTLAMASAPVAGAPALTWALKKIGFGVAKRGPVVLSAIGIASGTVSDVATEKAIQVIKEKNEEDELSFSEKIDIALSKI